MSRDDPAGEKEKPIRVGASGGTDFEATRIELTGTGSFPIGPPPGDEDDAGEAEIKAMFKGKLVALRRLPRRERAAALRAAREWFLMAMKAAREKRARDRYGKYMQWRLQIPRPG